MNAYERRIQRNRIRRNRQIKRRCFFSLLLFVTVLTVSFIVFGFKADAKSKNDTSEFKYYKSVTVSSGDTLYEYAAEFGKADMEEDFVKEVVRMNNLASEDITLGMNLIIPYYSTEFVLTEE